MLAVWSFWSKPYFAHRNSAWISELHHLLSWVLSVQSAQKYYPDTMLITDDAGARMLVDGIGLPFRSVSTALNELQEHDPALWSIGKIYAYHAQTEPFIHIDNDVFLWERLNPNLETADILAQNEEPFHKAELRYHPEEFEKVASSYKGVWFPNEWLWYRSSSKPQKGICCGIFGGVRVDFIKYYAALSIRFVEDPMNRPCWLRLGHISRGLLFEQYLLAACLEYHRFPFNSSFSDIQPVYLFNSLDAPYNPENAIQAGYTHLLADAKRNIKLTEQLRQWVIHDYPNHYEYCIKYAENIIA